MYQKLWIIAICFFMTLPNMGQNQPNFPDYGNPIRLEVAKKIVFKAQSEAKKNGWKMVISVVDSGGNLVLLEKMDGAQFASIDISQGKAKCANNFRRSTKSRSQNWLYF
ncbi:PF03928 domain protein [Leptospira kirschneri serovar Cynopteri str. 3522 CT]|nr:PF03928 domain protein [Leptospira kirschneri serovar Cynopteri str. 3522 CT]